MEVQTDALEFENDFVRQIYENKENFPRNEKSVQLNKDDLDNYCKEDRCLKVNDNKDNLPENLEEPRTPTIIDYRLLEDSSIKSSDCGVTFKSQHINIDFTSVPGVDDDAFLQQKCIDFWKFVSEHPKLQRLEIQKVNESYSNKAITNVISLDESSSQEIEFTAVNVQKNSDDIYQKACAARLKYTYCDHSDADYILGNTKVEQRPVKAKKRSNFSSLKQKSGVKTTSSNIKSRDRDEVKKLCHKMEEWDLSHPKSMEAPIRVPSSSYLK